MKTIGQQLKIKDFPFIINDKDSNEICYEDSTGYWESKKYNDKGNEIYNSEGFIINNKPKQVQQENIIEINGKKFKLVEM